VQASRCSAGLHRARARIKQRQGASPRTPHTDRAPAFAFATLHLPPTIACATARPPPPPCRYTPDDLKGLPVKELKEWLKVQGHPPQPGQLKAGLLLRAQEVQEVLLEGRKRAVKFKALEALEFEETARRLLHETVQVAVGGSRPSQRRTRLMSPSPPAALRRCVVVATRTCSAAALCQHTRV